MLTAQRRKRPAASIARIGTLLDVEEMAIGGPRLAMAAGLPNDVARHADVSDLSHESTRRGLAARARRTSSEVGWPAICPRTRCCKIFARMWPILCVHCHMCRLECPANVDIPKLMLEAKAAYVNTNGLTLHDRLLDANRHARRVCRSAAGHRELGNPQPSSPLADGKSCSASPKGRKLPQLARRSFLQQSAMRRLHHPPRTSGEKIVLLRRHVRQPL